MAELSQIHYWLVLMRDVADFLLQITLKNQVANRQIRKSKRPGRMALRLKVASSKFSILAEKLQIFTQFSRQFLNEPQLKNIYISFKIE